MGADPHTLFRMRRAVLGAQEVLHAVHPADEVGDRNGWVIRQTSESWTRSGVYWQGAELWHDGRLLGHVLELIHDLEWGAGEDAEGTRVCTVIEYREPDGVEAPRFELVLGGQG